MTPPAQTLIVVLGATGIQGGGVVSEFLKHSDTSWHIRAITRNISSSKAQTLASRSPNISLATADMNDPSSLSLAFRDATAIFAVTDFWSLYYDPANASKPSPGQELNEWCFEAEIQQGRNIFAAASQIPSLERMVFSTLSKPSKWSHGKHTYSLHFEGKGIATEYLIEHYPDLYKKTSLIQVGFYLENFLAHPIAMPTKDATGCFIFRDLGAGDNWPFAAAGPETGTITWHFVTSSKYPPSQHVIAYRGLMSLGEFVEIWGRVLGVKARVEAGMNIPEGTPESLKREFADNMAYCRDYGYWGWEDKSVRHPRDFEFVGEIGSVEEWVRGQDWSAVLSQ